MFHDNFTYREIQAQDLPTIFDVRVATWHNDNGRDEMTKMGITENSVERRLEDSHRGWLCEIEGQLVGFAMGDKTNGEMWVIAVLKEFEGRGIGKRLLGLVEDWLWSEGWQEIWLTTDTDETFRAVGFYRRVGWEDWKIESGDRYMRKHRSISSSPSTPLPSQRFPDHLASKRLQLRRLRRDDVEALCAYRSLPDVALYQGWETFGPDDAIRLIETGSAPESNIPGTWFQLAIVRADTDRVIGDCGLHCPEDDPQQMEIGITLSPRHQGCGYASEAVECLLDYVFGRLDKHRLFATIDILNRPAAAMFRRLGFRQEAQFVEHVWFKGRWSSEYVFAMLKREWEERRGTNL